MEAKMEKILASTDHWTDADRAKLAGMLLATVDPTGDNLALWLGEISEMNRGEIACRVAEWGTSDDDSWK